LRAPVLPRGPAWDSPVRRPPTGQAGMWGTRAWALALAACRALHATAYNFKDLAGADHSVGMKLAVEEETPEVLRSLVREYLTVQKVDPRDLWTARTNIFQYADYPVVHYACLLEERGEHLRVLLESGGPTEAETDSGVRPLHVAAKHGSVGALKVLLEAGADPRQQAQERVVHNNDVRLPGYDGMTAATMAAKAGQLEVLRSLLDAGGAAAESLLERDGNPSVGEGKGWAPIHYAVSKDESEVVHFLIFEVGWGEISAAEVAEAAPTPKLRSEVLLLGRTDSAEFQARRDKYLMQQAKRAGSEL